MKWIRWIYGLCFLLLFEVQAQTVVRSEDFIRDSIRRVQKPDQGPLAKQFDYILLTSKKFNESKLVREDLLLGLRRRSMDSLRYWQLEHEKQNAQLEVLQNQAADLTRERDVLRQQLDDVIKQKEGIDFLGLKLEKGTFLGIVWTLIGLGLLGSALFFFLYKRANTLTVDYKDKWQAVDAEYEEHRHRALEREQKLSRQLQDEILKNRKGSS